MTPELYPVPDIWPALSCACGIPYISCTAACGPHHLCMRGPVFQLVGMPSLRDPHHVASVACAESAPLRSSASFRNALIRRPVSDGLWLVRIQGQETRRLDSAISGALRVARLVSYLRRKRNYRGLHLCAAPGQDQWPHLVLWCQGASAPRLKLFGTGL